MVILGKIVLVIFATVTSSKASTNERKGRFFFVSTLSTTSVVSTTTICWKSNAAITATCTGRKKRFINLGKKLWKLQQWTKYCIDHGKEDVDIQATAPLVIDDDQPVPQAVHDDEKLSSGLEKSADDIRAREARFLIYWATSTSYKRSTTFTGTSTLATLECTPPSFAISECG